MKYRTEVDLSNLNSSQPAIARAIVSDLAAGSRILDVGCAAGDLGAALKGRGFVVSGIEADRESAEIASERLDVVVVADLETNGLGEIVEGPFDAIIFGDVLEHLSDPETVLKAAVGLLSPNGFIVASIPNIAHGSVRLALLLGQWNYTDEGLLDRTHLRFFTLKSIRELFGDAGLVISSIQATILDPLATEVLIDEQALPRGVLSWVRAQEDSFDFQYIVRGVPVHAADADVPRSLPEVDRLAHIERPNVQYAPRQSENSRFSEAVAVRNAEHLASFEKERYRLLTATDNAVALEAEVGRLRYEVQSRNDDLHQVRTELIETHARLAAAIADAESAHRKLDSLPHNLVRRGVGKIAREIGLR
ncbi:MAG: class I SAM-dependent methyltransferase [Actinomyces sp.]|jgi:2-polyprenyl-3-methyl-5-hydroxy-6-metoxy-1,4-benzoquinol methylase|nr:class I SAM-dependent methyltransferase [Actinomyces sp.]MCI1788860.1 class I SAM-dependent methyltransferase [Actinomyces sp.]MCI1829534.1 class I SAM-dependent methyltransferase [Actinomyces sp.]